MTDDFHLFADPGDGEPPIDADLALITAYLARELSPMQVLAVEERLLSDPEFRAAMQPVIDAWAAPVPSLAGASTVRAGVLSEREKSESWQRFQLEQSADAGSASMSTRRISMKRVAAVIGITVLPMVSFAQAVVYSAHHENAPGHAIATRIVAAFGGAPAPVLAPAPIAKIDPAADQPVARELPAPAALPVKRAPKVTVPAMAEIVVAEPDRAKIAELAKQHQPAVVRGDTAVDYIVMVVDASGKYVWSTYGIGSVSLTVGADPRTPIARRDETQKYREQFSGPPGADFYGRGRGARGAGATAGFSFDSSALYGATVRVRGTGDTVRYDTLAYKVKSVGGLGADTAFGAFSSRMGTARGGGGGGRGGSGGSGGNDTGAIRRIDRVDSIPRLVVARGGGGGGAMGAGGGFGAGGGGRARGGSGGSITFSPDSTNSKPGLYHTGWTMMRNGSTAGNSAPGLQESSNTESGIQGLLANSVTAADLYFFYPGQLAPGLLRVMVVHLAAGASWKGR